MKTFARAASALLALLVLLAPAAFARQVAPPADLPTNLVAAGTPAGMIRLWSVGASSGDPTRHLNDIKVHDGAVTALAWSPEKRLAATGGADKKIKIWQVVGGGDQPVRTIETAHEGTIVALQFTSGGDKLVSAGADGRVRTWNVADGKRLTDVEASKKPLTALVAVPEWDLLFTADADGESKIWEGGKPTATPAHKGAVVGLALVPNQEAYATAGADGYVRIWAGENGGKREIKAHDGPITGFAITASGRRIVTAGADGSVKIWDAEKLTLQSEIKNAHPGGVTAICLPPDGPRLFTVGADKKVKVWKILDGSPVATLDAPASDGPASDRLLFVRLNAAQAP